MSDARPPSPPKALARPPRGRVLVLAPHPDDETMGAGGTLALHADQGDDIHAVFISSGIQGDPDAWFPRERLAQMRQDEARAAAAVLGISRLTFFGYPDNLTEADFSAVFGGLPTDPVAQRHALIAGLASKLGELLDAEAPRHVYHPWRGELNGDHWAVGRAVDVLRETRPDLAARTSFLGYDIWTASAPDVVVDISDTAERKLRAVRCYETQIHYRNYEPAVRGLNAYRALFLEQGAVFGEGFVGGYVNESGG